MTIVNSREIEHNIDNIFPNRWSPRAMSGEPITNEELFRLFEASRWAPSAYNEQPWHFFYAKKETKHWESFYNLLTDGNKIWTNNAAVLVIIASNKNFSYNKKPSITHSFDTGAAWANIALQGSLMNLVIHGMSGFDYDKAKEIINISNDYQIEAMFAIGKPGKKKDLPEKLQKMESPSDRKKISEFIFEGKFKEEK